MHHCSIVHSLVMWYAAFCDDIEAVSGLLLRLCGDTTEGI